MLSALMEWMNDLVDAVYCMLVSLWCWFRDKLIDALTIIVEWILDALPSNGSRTGGSWQSIVNDSIEYLAVVDLWVPVKEGFILYSAFLGFLLVFIVVKFVLKLIPTVG